MDKNGCVALLLGDEYVIGGQYLLIWQQDADSQNCSVRQYPLYADWQYGCWQVLLLLQ